MKLFIIGLALLTVAACSTREPHDARVTDDHVILSGSQGTIADVSITREDYVGTIEIPFGRAMLWPLLPEAYEQVGLPAPAVDTDTWAVAVQNHTVSRRLGTERLSNLIDCGSDMTGRLADTHRIRLSVRTWLEHPGGANTLVRTRVEAVASSVEGRPGSFPCQSRGELERRIARALRDVAS